LLEAGELEAAILHPFTGILHRSSIALWRRHDADRMIEKERAPIPHSPNTGSLVVKEFHVRSRAGIGEMIDVLQEKVATESLKRPQQKAFVRERFPTYWVTEDQFREIFQEVPVPTGRPKKSDKRL
jgi:hypothetical protein